mmetsp:Transcript_42259/g.62621  ORF Transcript_42259/g.62621 Transcript_42259/m.62621 type:complete len:165 (+) Transcript_42259:119-613(+)
MSNIASVAEWDNEYARLARAAAQMRAVGSSTTLADQRDLHQNLSRLNDGLQFLSLPPQEIARRRRLVQGLQANPVLAQQDEMIDDLAAGMSRLKAQTQMIGEEAKLHNRLLDDMEQQADMAQLGLAAETARAARIKEDRSIWRLQLMIAGLSVLLVLLILMGLT